MMVLVYPQAASQLPVGAPLVKAQRQAERMACQLLVPFSPELKSLWGDPLEIGGAACVTQRRQLGSALINQVLKPAVLNLGQVIKQAHLAVASVTSATSISTSRGDALVIGKQSMQVVEPRGWLQERRMGPSPMIPFGAQFALTEESLRRSSPTVLLTVGATDTLPEAKPWAFLGKASFWEGLAATLKQQLGGEVLPPPFLTTPTGQTLTTTTPALNVVS